MEFVEAAMQGLEARFMGRASKNGEKDKNSDPEPEDLIDLGFPDTDDPIWIMGKEYDSSTGN